MSVPHQIKRPAENARSAASVVSTEDEIRWRAYELYQERGGEDNHDVDDWLRAEEEISRNRGTRKAA